ncbi:MAG TPA: carboxypeptidase-like regulatory domain-containing protein, partial [Verrucomicrobiae bacterium]|nr:carboxypeptidase-like regulatory domain-containing protein [Verrucomicrobiae bacterium]
MTIYTCTRAQNLVARLSLALCLLAIAILMPDLALRVSAQSTNASISGAVVDSSGANVPNAEVNLSAQATGRKATFTTGSDGLFSFPNLQAGAYEITVEAKGFGKYVQKGVVLNINQQARLTINLKVGSQVQTV